MCLLLTALALAIGTTIGSLRGQSQNEPPSAKKAAATPMQEEIMTRKQREHSKLYKSSSHGRRKLRDYPDGIEKILPPPWYEDSDGNAPTSTEELLKAVVCNADAVVVGVINSKSSQFTADGNSIFTDYDMTVEEVLKDNPNAHIELSSNLVITRHGGAIELNGKIFRVLDQSFMPLAVGGKYLLSVRFIPGTGAYQALNSESSFELKQNNVSRLTRRPSYYPFSYEDNPHAFVAQVRTAIGSCEKAGGAK